jgi:ADP-ribose pyrophosphatase YjhB (NUDIX family)
MSTREVHRLVADVALLAAGKVALVKYGDPSLYDGQRGWFLPDDLLAEMEHPEDAARRILRDQVGLADAAPRLSHVESFGNGWWHLVFHFVAETTRAVELQPGANVAAAEWFDLDALPPADEQAHDGWAGEVLVRIRAEAASHRGGGPG